VSELPEEHPDWKRIDEALDTLAEHFDSVHLFCTKYESASEGDDGESGTIAMSAGRGNIYARIGLIREWLIRQDERGRLKEKEP
jgi:hypothetical protein